jgi:hypothetical protein
MKHFSAEDEPKFWRVKTHIRPCVGKKHPQPCWETNAHDHAGDGNTISNLTAGEHSSDSSQTCLERKYLLGECSQITTYKTTTVNLPQGYMDKIRSNVLNIQNDFQMFHLSASYC